MELNYLTVTPSMGGADMGQDYVNSRIISLNADYSIAGQHGVNIREANHSHPNGSTVISQGDVNVARRLQSSFPNATMHNYTKKSGYTPFNRHSTPGLLPIITIRP
jgi:hypothetical protein